MAAKTSRRTYVRHHWPLAQRLDYRTDKSGGPNACWTWMGTTDTAGYGKMGWKGHDRLAHHLSWIATHGPIPSGRIICHRCDNPPCVNPAHLFCDTHAGNSADKVAKGRQAKGAALASFGERNGNSRLSAEIVCAIRAAIGTQRGIARQFGTSQRTVLSIRKRQTWRHLP